MKKKDRQTVNFIKEKAEELFYENLGPDGEIAENIRQIYIEFGSETKNFKEADISYSSVNVVLNDDKLSLPFAVETAQEIHSDVVTEVGISNKSKGREVYIGDNNEIEISIYELDNLFSEDVAFAANYVNENRYDEIKVCLVGDGTSKEASFSFNWETGKIDVDFEQKIGNSVNENGIKKVKENFEKFKSFIKEETSCIKNLKFSMPAERRKQL